MRYFLILLGLTFVVSAFSFTTHQQKQTIQNGIDTLEAERNRYMKMVLESIKGKEKWNADSVFKNLRTFKGVKGFTAEHFLQMMNFGWGKGLGVSCTYCHNPNDWASEEKSTKEIGREMYDLRGIINQRLSSIWNLQSKPALINCITCHQGYPIPVTD